MKQTLVPILLAGALLLPLHAAAAEHTYTVSEKPVGVSVGQVTVTPEELKAADYLVPVIVRMDPNPGFNVLEFGISSALPYEVLSPDDTDPETERGAMICALPTAPKSLHLTCALTSEQRKVKDQNVTWFVMGSAETRHYRNLTVLLVRVPDTAQPGDSFEITFLSKSVSIEPDAGMPAYSTRWDDAGTLVHYQSPDDFEGFSGSIMIAEPEPTEPATTEPATTEPAATEPTEPELHYTLGDVKEDGAVNSKDAALVLQAAARIGTNVSHGLTKAQFAAADTNRDGTISAKDASQILQYAAQIGTGYKGGMEDYLGY